jgi:plasmid stabilization system protein ParE
MRGLVYRASAYRDLTDILIYVTRESGSRAIGQGFAAALEAQCDHLAPLPGTVGRARLELGPDIRSFAFKGYAIFFRSVADAPELIDVFEGHRDVVGYFQNDTD